MAKEIENKEVSVIRVERNYHAMIIGVISGLSTGLSILVIAKLSIFGMWGGAYVISGLAGGALGITASIAAVNLSKVKDQETAINSMLLGLTVTLACWMILFILLGIVTSQTGQTGWVVSSFVAGTIIGFLTSLMAGTAIFVHNKKKQ